jgi:hypothetical protein
VTQFPVKIGATSIFGTGRPSGESDIDGTNPWKESGVIVRYLVGVMRFGLFFPGFSREYGEIDARVIFSPVCSACRTQTGQLTPRWSGPPRVGGDDDIGRYPMAAENLG